MRLVSIILFAVCFLSLNTVSAQKKSCSKADMAKCAKAMGMTIEECAKKCPMAASFLAAKAETNQAKIVPVSLTAEEQIKVASSLQEKNAQLGKTYKCKMSKASCSKATATTRVAALEAEKKKKVARA